MDALCLCITQQPLLLKLDGCLGVVLNVLLDGVVPGLSLLNLQVLCICGQLEQDAGQCKGHSRAS